MSILLAQVDDEGGRLSIELAGEVRYLRSNFQRGLKYVPVKWRRK